MYLNTRPISLNKHPKPPKPPAQRNDPPPRWKPPCEILKSDKLPRIEDMDTFRIVHWNNEYRILNYVERPRRNYYRPDPELWPELRPEAEDEMYAANPLSRIAFAKLVLKQVKNHPQGPKGGFFFVTLTPERYAFPLHRAWDINLDSLMAFARQALRGINFVGMVDAALYKKWGRRGPATRDWVVWHVHLIVWGATRDRVEAALQHTRKTNKTVVPGRHAVWVQHFRAHLLEAKLLYSLKKPQKEYNVSRELPDNEIDWETGEVTPVGFRQQKRPLRTGDRVRMCQVLLGKRLPELFFGNKVGTDIARRVRRKLG
jgi:hypothetical protein